MQGEQVSEMPLPAGRVVGFRGSPDSVCSQWSPSPGRLGDGDGTQDKSPRALPGPEEAVYGSSGLHTASRSPACLCVNFQQAHQVTIAAPGYQRHWRGAGGGRGGGNGGGLLRRAGPRARMGSVGHAVVHAPGSMGCCSVPEQGCRGTTPSEYRRGDKGDYAGAGGDMFLLTGIGTSHPIQGWHSSPAPTKAPGPVSSSSRMGQCWHGHPAPSIGRHCCRQEPPAPSPVQPCPGEQRAALAARLNLNRWDIASRRGGIFQTSRSPHTRLSRCMPCPPLAKVSGRQSFPKTSKARSPRCGCALPSPAREQSQRALMHTSSLAPPAPARRCGCQEPAPGRRVPAGVRSGSPIQARTETIARADLGGQLFGKVSLPGSLSERCFPVGKAERALTLHGQHCDTLHGRRSHTRMARSLRLPQGVSRASSRQTSLHMHMQSHFVLLNP